MARQVLPIAGSIVTGHTGKLSWWRRGLIALAGVGLPRRSAKGGGPGRGYSSIKLPISGVLRRPGANADAPAGAKPASPPNPPRACTGFGEG